MLVLSRGERQSVVIGDEIKMTVEQIAESNSGRKVFGATVRFGFEAPRYVSVCRNELLPKPRRAGAPGATAQRKQRLSGQIVTLPDVVMRLRIQVPQKVPVSYNGAPTAGQRPRGRHADLETVYHITCRKEDRITICNNICIAVLDFHRFVRDEPAARHAGRAAASEGGEVPLTTTRLQ